MKISYDRGVLKCPMHCFPIHAPGIAALPGPSGPSSDNVETQPMGDILAAVPTESLMPTASPEIPSSKIRAKYQNKGRKLEFPGIVAESASAVSFLIYKLAILFEILFEPKYTPWYLNY